MEYDAASTAPDTCDSYDQPAAFGESFPDTDEAASEDAPGTNTEGDTLYGGYLVVLSCEPVMQREKVHRMLQG